MKKKFFIICTIISIFMFFQDILGFADEENDNKFYIVKSVNCGDDDGFVKNAITISDMESAIQKIIDMISNTEYNNESACLTNCFL